MAYIAMKTLLFTILLLLLPIVRSDDVIPADKSAVDSWFNTQVNAIAQKVSLGAAKPKVLKVNADGKGDFKTLTDALKTIPEGNKEPVVVWIGPGNYTEKIHIKNKPYITLYGDPNNNPVLVFGGTALEYGTVYSGTLAVDSEHFSAVNLKIVNSAPRPDGKMKLAQAVALRADGDYQSYYNCKFYGFQDTLCDIRGKHLFKNCYIEGTVDFIFGTAKSLYLDSEIHVIPGDPMAIIAASARKTESEVTGFSFVHCSVTGTGGIAYLGRSWYPYAKVVYSYCDLSDVVHPEGWFNNYQPQTNKTVYFGEYNNKGAGASFAKRAPFVKKLGEGDVKPFISLSYIEAYKWLLPPLKL